MMKDRYKVLITSCWSLLLVCLVVKLFGGNWFDICSENSRFIALCEFIDNNMILKIIVNCIMSLILTSLSTLAIMKQVKYTKLQCWLFIPLILSSSIISWYFPIIKTIIDIIVLAVLPIIFKTNWKRVIVGIVLILAFQVLSIVIKNVGNWYLNNESTLISILINIDSLIMVVLYYLYSNYNREEKK